MRRDISLPKGSAVILSSKMLALGALFLLPVVGAVAQKPVPVLVELFTSEGCSSCPPADVGLMRLAQQPVAGVEIVPLSLHVDYWNRLGWADPFSSAAFSDRQSAYSRAWGVDRVYTPQMVIDGRSELVGSDETRAARRAIEEASRLSKAIVEVTKTPAGDGAASLHIVVRGLSSATPGDTAEVWLAVTEDRLASDVVRGENAGRQLAHTAVVRELTVVGSAKMNVPFEANRPLHLKADWKRDALHAVAFVQERKSRKVLGVARIGL